LESYYGDYEGIETVTLSIAGTETEETSFVIPKLNLIRASPVFRRMFANEMTEKATGKVDIKDTTPEEFSDFLKAISPKQEHPTRRLYACNKFSFTLIQIISSIKCVCFTQIGRPL
jgi:hypothetical protein